MQPTSQRLPASTAVTQSSTASSTQPHHPTFNPSRQCGKTLLPLVAPRSTCPSKVETAPVRTGAWRARSAKSSSACTATRFTARRQLPSCTCARSTKKAPSRRSNAAQVFASMTSCAAKMPLTIKTYTDTHLLMALAKPLSMTIVPLKC